jgi:hypothetical protein
MGRFRQTQSVTLTDSGGRIASKDNENGSRHSDRETDLSPSDIGNVLLQ